MSTVFDTASWLVLRFERGARYYRLHLEQDLWGGWLVTRVNGRRGAALGRVASHTHGNLDRALLALAAAAKRRCRRGYRLST